MKLMINQVENFSKADKNFLKQFKGLITGMVKKMLLVELGHISSTNTSNFNEFMDKLRNINYI